MFENNGYASIKKMFADQFEPDGEGFIYRKSMKGPAIRVTDSERDAFLALFNRRLRLTAWSIFPLTVVVLLAISWMVPDASDATIEVFVLAGLALIMVPFMASYYWAWNAPARELARRTPVESARTKAEVRRMKLARMSYGQLAMVIPAAALMLWNASKGTDVLHGWGLLWSALAALLIGLSAIQAFRKWRLERP